MHPQLSTVAASLSKVSGAELASSPCLIDSVARRDIFKGGLHSEVPEGTGHLIVGWICSNEPDDS